MIYKNLSVPSLPSVVNTTYLIGTKKNNDQPIVELVKNIIVFVYTDSKVYTCPFQYQIVVCFFRKPDVPHIAVFPSRNE